MSKKKGGIAAGTIGVVAVGIAMLLSKCSGFGLGDGDGNGDKGSSNESGNSSSVTDTMNSDSSESTDEIKVTEVVDVTTEIAEREEICVQSNDYIYKNKKTNLEDIIADLKNIADCEVYIIQDKASYDAIENLKLKLEENNIEYIFDAE